MCPLNEDSESGGEIRRSIRQLWSTQIQDMQQMAASLEDVGFCVCSVQPVLISDIGTRRMSFCRIFVDMLQDRSPEKSSLLFNEQC